MLILTAYANSLFHCHGNGGKGRYSGKLIAPKLSEKDFCTASSLLGFAPYLVHLRINGRNIALELIKGYTYLGEIVPASIAMFLFLLALLEYDGRA